MTFSCRLLIDAVYEPHWQHYREDFGKTIAGFFSDEPELGNGHIFCNDNLLGTDQDLPFAAALPPLLRESLGEDWAARLYLLWENTAGPAETARVRFAYMDAVTRLVRDSFSCQLGDWCHAHGVHWPCDRGQQRPCPHRRQSWPLLPGPGGPGYGRY